MRRSCGRISLVRAAQKKSEQAIGRSVAGHSTKIHTLCDALGNPIGFHLTPGQVHDLEGADHLLAQVPPRTPLLADRAYDADQRVRDRLKAQGSLAVIPSKANRRTPSLLNRHLYRARHLIENFFAKLKQYRAIATRYDQSAQHFLSAIYLAAAVIWLN